MKKTTPALSATNKGKRAMEFSTKDLMKKIEFNRRNFIKVMVGGAVGINLSPLPWKLTDDIAIWTQNWPWLPVPPVGEFSHVKSVCHLCPGGCGIEVRKVDNRAVKIEGRTDYPVNPGGICPLGAGGLQLLYNENIRFTSPMKRFGPRGSGQFKNISWDEALKELTDRIGGLRRQGKPEALAAVDGHPMRSSMALLIQRLLEAVGSPNYVRIPSVEDTYAMVNRIMLGSAGPVAYDLENADFILSFGSGLIEGWGSPGRMINAWGIWREDPLKGKTKVVQIESRVSNTASKADQWVAPLPGTEAALALGIAHVMIKEGLYDTKFIQNYSFGFVDWTAAHGKDHKGFKALVLEKYSPVEVARITGLDYEDIVSLARAFAKARAPIALCGKGKGNLNGSLFEFMAVHSLNALVGNINKPGGVLVHDPLPLSPWPDVKLDAIARNGLEKNRLDQAGSRKYPFSQSLINNLTEAILEGPSSPVDTLLIFSGNPAYTLPDGGSFNNALKKVPYIVSFSPYQDETSFMADLVLPDHNYLEKMDDIVWPTGLQYPLYALSQPVVEPLYDTRQSGDVIIQLAKMMGGAVGSAFPWKNFEESLKARAKGLFESGGGLTRWEDSPPVWKGFAGRSAVKSDYKSFDEMWKKIKSNGFWYRPTHSFENWQTLFDTPTGRFEFFSTDIELAVNDLARGSSMESALQNMGIAAKGDEAFMPHYEAPASAVDRKKYPLLMMPYGLINLSSDWLPNPPYLKKTLFDDQLRKDESFAEINPKTAVKYNLQQGDRVIIQSPKGELKVRVNLFKGAMPGVVYLPLGLGHTAYDVFQRGQGVNPNEIMDGRKDPLSGLLVWWDTPIRIIKA
ncbi:MAG: molybdopterin-dependent oxidoreductase [Deltaproteobacteria bacterium]|nr:MAG: molybdopterin-dependent oxidoreductase [Deltaproteobacteria bacterium]